MGPGVLFQEIMRAPGEGRKEPFHPSILYEGKKGRVRKRKDFLEFQSSYSAAVELSENDAGRDQCSPFAQ